MTLGFLKCVDPMDSVSNYCVSAVVTTLYGFVILGIELTQLWSYMYMY